MSIDWYFYLGYDPEQDRVRAQGMIDSLGRSSWAVKLVIAGAILLAALAVMDLADVDFVTDLASHPFAASLLIEGELLAMTYLIFDKAIERRDRAAWRAASTATFIRLVRLVTLAIQELDADVGPTGGAARHEAFTRRVSDFTAELTSARALISRTEELAALADEFSKADAELRYFAGFAHDQLAALKTTPEVKRRLEAVRERGRWLEFNVPGAQTG